jgi:hypothetical protein
MPIHSPAAMLNMIFNSLTRLRPQASPAEAVQPWTNEDIGWHNSSFELARGLDVIEHRDLALAVFADTMPAFQRAEA